MQWPPTPEAGLVDVRVRLGVRRGDHLVDVDADPLGVPGELVGEGDVHVAVGRVGELAELGRLGVAHRDDLGVEDRVVEGRGAGRRGRADPADELRVGREVAERGAAVEPLRRERDEQVLVRGQPGRLDEPRQEAVAGVADRQRRLEDHERAGVDAGRDRGDRRVHVPVVGLLLVVEHHRDDQDDDVGRAGGLGAVGRRPEPAAGVGGRDELGEAGLLGDVRPARR